MGAAEAGRWNPLPRAQALWHAVAFTLTGLSGTLAGQILTAGITSTVQGSMVTLKCELASTNASVTQVIWDKCDKNIIAVFKDKESRVQEPFKEKFTVAEGYGITIQSAEYTDTGGYCCVFYTFPDGRYDGKVFLEVKEPVEGTHHSWVIGVLLGGLLLLILLATVGIALKPKWRQLLYQTISCTRNDYKPSADYVNTQPIMMSEFAISEPTAEQEEEGSEGAYDYFNVLQYRSVDHGKPAVATCKDGSVVRLEDKERP